MNKKPVNFETISITGLVFILVSFLVQVFFRKQLMSESGILDLNTLFFINYGFAIVYFIIMFVDNFRKERWKFRFYSRNNFIYSMVLFSLSCFSLNFSLKLFSKFTDWMVIYLLIIHCALILSTFNLKKITRKITVFFLGSGVLLLFYFTIYLLPFVPFGILGAFFFGLSLHLIIPVILLILFILQYFRISQNEKSIVPFLSGVTVPLVFLIIFIVTWNKTNEKVRDATRTVIMDRQNTLPKWILTAQKLPINAITEKIIASEIMYDAPNNFWNFNGLGRNSFSENKKHDPLILISTALSGKINLSREDRIKILKSVYNKRHLAYRKLWSGNKLVTSDIITDISIYPENRLAYIEKIFTIKNTETNRFNNQQEALYSFYLPEGAAVSSLSLWINGKEEQSRLTTRGKADSAYVEIVGYERRDPALLHWQEGNTVTVTIFPCTPDEPRIFKTGFTVPLTKNNNMLELNDIFFEGPDIDNSEELIKLTLKASSEANAEIPSFFNKKSMNTYEYSGNSKKRWTIKMPASPLSSAGFIFNGKSYIQEEYNPQLISKSFSNIFLDINKEWTKEEIAKILDISKDRSIYVHTNTLIKLTEQNRKQIIDELLKLNFSIFPLNVIKNPEQSLIITKSNDFSPHLTELSETEFIKNIKDYFSEKSDLNVYNLGNGKTGYIKGLNEFDLFNYSEGNIEKLIDFISNNKFELNQNSNDQIVLGNSGMIIRQVTENITSKAPDHIMRLFAYKWILHNMGNEYFTDRNHFTSEQIALANEAFIASPISSLVVLESKNDYDRFGIAENKNSLKNASQNSSGAVPEPYEWVLIICIALTLIWLYRRKSFGFN